MLTDRGIANFNQQEWIEAGRDLSEAISTFERGQKWTGYSSWGLALFLRGMILIHLQDEQLEKALQDLESAKEKGHDVATEFRKEYGSIAEFENQYNLFLPDGIKDVLTNNEVGNKT